MNLTAREKRTVLVGAVVAVAVLGGSFLLAPLARRWAELGDELAPKLQQVEELRQLAQRCDVLRARRNRLVRGLGSLLGPATTHTGPASGAAAAANPEGADASPTGLPATPGSGAFSLAAHLGRVAKSSNMKVKRISARKPTSGEKRLVHFERVALQVSAEGNIRSLLKLLHGLEKGDRLVRIERFSLTHNLKKRGAVTLTMDLVGYVPAGTEP